MSTEPVVVNLDEKIASLERKLAMYKELRAEEAAAHGGSNGAAPKPTSLPRRLEPIRLVAANPAYKPKGAISGTQGAEQFLEREGKPRNMSDVRRGALALGANISYGALYAMITESAKKERTFTYDRKRKLVGLRKWLENA